MAKLGETEFLGLLNPSDRACLMHQTSLPSSDSGEAQEH